MFVFASYGDFWKDKTARRAEASSHGVDRRFRRSARARILGWELARIRRRLADRISGKFGQEPPVGRKDEG